MLHLYTSLRDFSIVIIDKVQCVHATSCQFKSSLRGNLYTFPNAVCGWLVVGIGVVLRRTAVGCY